MRQYKHLDTITVLFVTVLLTSNIASTKILDFGVFTFDGGTILFPLSYIFGDILTEVYGYSKSRRTIWYGFAAALIMSLTLMLVGKLPPAADWPYQEAFDNVLGLTPRIVAASLIAYFCGEFLNSYVLAKLKIFTKGKMLWTRTIGSTVVGEFADTIVFVLLAFWGEFSSQTILTLIVSNYVFKTGVEVLLTPVTYEVVGFLKRSENEDHYDYGTNFSPFKLQAE